MEKKILITYYENNAKKLHAMVDKIIMKFGGLSDKDLDDFYSLANEVFADVINKYDNSKSFDAFLYSCLSNKIKTEITRRNRQKRQADRLTVSLDMPIGDDINFTLADMIADKTTVEDELFRDEEYSMKMVNYLASLSELQRKILKLIIADYLPDEIREILHINQKQYADCNAAIHAYRNVSILF